MSALKYDQDSTLTLYITPCFIRPLIVESHCILSVVWVYLHLCSEKSTWFWIIQTHAKYERHYPCRRLFPTFPLCVTVILLCTEPLQRVVILRSSCLWRRGRESTLVSRKSQLANLQLLQTPRRLIVMMRYDGLNLCPQRLYISDWDRKKTIWTVLKQFEIYKIHIFSKTTDYFSL